MAEQETMDRRVRWLLYALLALAVLGFFLPGAYENWTRPEISFSEFRTLARDGKVSEVTLRGHRVEGTLTDEMAIGPQDIESRNFSANVPEFGRPEILSLLQDRDVEISVEPADTGTWGWLVFLLPWILILGVYIWFMRRAMQGGGGIGGLSRLGQSKLKRIKPEDSEVRFEDVAGQEAAKRDVCEVVEYLRDPGRFTRLGADVPHGLLLVGPPGTGKTLMARALAGEANVPFFHTSGSEFIEMVVGVGASRVRQTFQEAKENAPSIVFIDELDAIGRQRGTGMGGGNDEREQTLNQILNEMDGFTGKEAVVVLAATNRPDVLDPALVRPGRFDRRLVLDLPDREARGQILDIHTGDVPLADDVDLDEIAAVTPGFSGADLENMVNEAAMAAARDDLDKVTQRHLVGARDKVTMGPERALTIDDAEKHRLAVHESGHTTVAWFLPDADRPMKVTIIPRGRALGGTHQMPEIERYIADVGYLRDRLAVMLAGRAAEHAFLGDVSSGAEDDIRQATDLARSMVARWGMSSDLGPIDLSQDEQNPFLGREMASPRQFSEETARELDQAVRTIITEATDRARDVIESHRGVMETLVARLEERETLERDAIRACLSPEAETSNRAGNEKPARTAQSLAS